MFGCSHWNLEPCALTLVLPPPSLSLIDCPTTSERQAVCHAFHIVITVPGSDDASSDGGPTVFLCMQRACVCFLLHEAVYAEYTEEILYYSPLQLEDCFRDSAETSRADLVRSWNSHVAAVDARVRSPRLSLLN
ncbi:hypothetical protein HD554DRAFT_1248149 [Boletus coccyginus]|nr:hypothetical protein HD554DRAFT_1248149 [Boletus coccyginus]